MAETPDPKTWRPRPSPVATAFRGMPAEFKLYCLQRVGDVTRHGRRVFGSCLACKHFAPIHPFYLNFRFGKPLDPNLFLVDMEKRLKCTGCGNKTANCFVVEAAPGEAAAPRERHNPMFDRDPAV